MTPLGIRETEFDLCAVDDRIMGAGVLPVRIVRGTVQLLLGKERYVSNWRGSHKWSGFEGGRKPGEDIESTAAREFIEESISSVRLIECNTTIASVVQALKAKKYIARIALCIMHGPHNEPRYQITYLMEASHSHDCEACFVARRKTLMRFDNHAKLLDDGDDDLVRARMAQEYQNLDAACRAAIECDEHHNVVRVIDDFVEKQVVQWWTLRDLEEVLQNGGFVNANFFRAYFLPVLCRAVQELRSYDDGGSGAACEGGSEYGCAVCAPCEDEGAAPPSPPADAAAK